MNSLRQTSNSLARRLFHGFALGALLASALAVASLWSAPGVEANHPVLVEGERDYDGDGMVGMAEDTDNATDRTFGTITAALAAANGAANQNGRVTIVTSGRFHEQVVITNANGNSTVEAAPGVEATIDAVGTGDRANQFPASNNAMRQAQPGVVVNSPANRYVTLRNLVIRNWTDGILVMGASRVAIDNCRLEGNVNYGIHSPEQGKVSISNSQVNSTGFRVSSAGDFPSANNQPNPGIGIAFRSGSTGNIINTSVTGSFGAGVANFTGNAFAIGVLGVNAFDNNPNFTGIRPPRGSAPTADSPFPRF